MKNGDLVDFKIFGFGGLGNYRHYYLERVYWCALRRHLGWRYKTIIM